jgi:hypothetical protein
MNVNVQQFGAIPDAKLVSGEWTGTDNADAFNSCAAHCVSNGYTMLVPRGNYGVSETIWLTDGDPAQASINMMGSNRGAYLGQSTSANICVLSDFEAGDVETVQKSSGTRSEPNLIPVLGIKNGRQVHIEGIGIQGEDRDDLVCAVAIGNVSQLVSIKNCSLHNTYAGVVFPGIRSSPTTSVTGGNNDLLLIEQCTFDNLYNIVCADTQPFACEYRLNRFVFHKSAFTGTLINNYYRQSRGSHKFSSNLFASSSQAGSSADIVYFNIAFNEITIDSNQFEAAGSRDMAEVLIRAYPDGGQTKRYEHFAFTNNIVNFLNVDDGPSKFRSLFDTFWGNRMIIQGNQFSIGTACRLKLNGAVLTGNVINLTGPHNLSVVDDPHELAGTEGDVETGRYDFNHLIRSDSGSTLAVPGHGNLTLGTDFTLHQSDNAFNLLAPGKTIMDNQSTLIINASYYANDAGKVMFKAYGKNQFNPPHGWDSYSMIFSGNKLIYKTDAGVQQEMTLTE